MLAAAASAGWGQPAALSVVNAATYVSQISPGGIATAFGANLPTDSATTVSVCEPGNPPTACTPATILGTYPSQISFLVPDPLPLSQVTVQVGHGGVAVASGSVAVSSLSPGVFTADNSGTGILNGQSYDGGQYDPVFTVAGSAIVPKAVASTSGSGPNVLILYGTGWKHATQANVRLTVGGLPIMADYAGPSSYPGLDQINVQIPAGLAAQAAQIAGVSIAFLYASDSPTGVYNTRPVQFCLAGKTGDTNCPSVAAPQPSCAEPLPGVSAPYAPHGLFALVGTGANLPVIANDILNQPTVCGASLYVVWSAVDQGNGNYNWTQLDAEIDQWAQAGKSANLIVWGVSDTRPNNGTPAYVLNDPNYQSVTCQENGVTLQYPVYYAGSYPAYYKTFIQAVMSRYGGNPNIGYIRFGLARGGEVFPTCLSQMMTFSGFSTIDQFNAQWESYLTGMLQFHKQLQTQIVSASGSAAQLMTALDQYGSPVQYAVTDFEAANAKSFGFGFGSQGLSASDISAFNAGRPCAADWCASFQSDYGLVPLELQTIAASDPTNAPGGTGSLVDLLPFALGLHAQIFEVYIQDLQVAYDPTSSSYAKYGQAYQAVFQQVAAKVGLAPRQ